MAIPNFQDLYTAFKDAILGEPESDLSDFSSGSRLDGYAMVAATAGQHIIRKIARSVLQLYVATAEGDDLTKLVRDRYSIERQANETDAELRERVKGWLAYNGAATRPALLFYAAEWTQGVESATVDEDMAAGASTLEATAEDGETPADVLEALELELDYWRPLNVPVNVKVS